MSMNCFLVILALLLSTQSHLPNTPTSFLSLLNNLNDKRNEPGLPTSKILRLNKDVVIFSTIPIRSEDVSLIGNRTTFLFQEHHWPNSEHPVSSPNQQSTSRTSPRSPQSSDDETTATMFMFDVRNSTFCVEGVDALVNSDSKSICSLAGSFVRFSWSSITSSSDICPFVIMSSENGETSLGSTVMLCDVTHHSRSDSIAPFVGLVHPHSSLVSSASSDLSDLHNAEMEVISVIGTGLRLESQDLFFGTGPLFSFGMIEHGSYLGASGCPLRMETHLLSSTLVNVSSSSAFSPGKQLLGSEVSQLVIGSFVRKCMNHDSGTGMISPNLGGNLMCLNTSFSLCIRQTNAVKVFQNRNFTQGSRLNAVTSDVTSVSFTLCTFKDMTVSTASYHDGGAAINLYETSSSLTIRTCFFHKCTCTGFEDDAGAVFFWGLSSGVPPPFSMSASSFTECSSLSVGGSLFVAITSSASMDCCFIERSKAVADGVMYVNSDAIAFSNSSFVECSATKRAGCIYFGRLTSFSLSFLRFRGCSSENMPDARDLILPLTSTEVTSDIIQSCDSTSGAPNILFGNDGLADGTLVPQLDPSTIPTVKSVTVSYNGNEATVRVETTKPIKGTMAVLLNGSNVPRLVHVVFGDAKTLSNLGTAVVSSGANGILPSATYSHRKSTLAPFPVPTVRTADATLKDWNTTEIVLKGDRLEEGSYWMLVENGENEWNITLTRSDSTTLIGTATLDPSTAEDRLEWSTEYEVTKVMCLPEGEEPEQDIALADSVVFTTPAEPPRTHRLAVL